MKKRLNKKASHAISHTRRLWLNKKASHVGFILSFVLFVTSVVFFFVLLSPSLNPNSGLGKQNTLNSLEERLLENFTAELKSVALSVNTGSSSCLTFLGLGNTAGLSNKLVANDGEGNSFDISISGNDIYIDRETTGAEFFKVYSSEEFPESDGDLTGCTSLTEGTGSDSYEIGLIREEDWVFSSRITSTLNVYNSDYDSLKLSLGVPGTSEFSFNFTYSNGTTIGALTSESLGNIYSQRTQITYMDQQGNSQQGFLDIYVW